MKRGFTLIEILITITIFSIVITAFLGLFGSAFRWQKESLSASYLLNNASYITEYMSRALRMAKKDKGVGCISYGDNFEPSEGESNEIEFLNHKGECQRFFLQGGVMGVEKNGISQVLTPQNLEVEDLKFKISGGSQEDNFQPKVTFSLKLKNNEQELNLQTTISQRDLDVRY